MKVKSKANWLHKFMVKVGLHRSPEKVRANSVALRYPYELFNGAVIPKRHIAEKFRKSGEKLNKKKSLPTRVRFNKRFTASQMEDGNYIVQRNGKAIPAVATYLSSNGWWARQAKTI